MHELVDFFFSLEELKQRNGIHEAAFPAEIAEDLYGILKGIYTMGGNMVVT